ncbi:MAG: hypothetical protein KDA91_03250 [Planctomycetaceae bacterium]|nr:hypothetical protein [Planctomycetaceae bacterium]
MTDGQPKYSDAQKPEGEKAAGEKAAGSMMVPEIGIVLWHSTSPQSLVPVSEAALWRVFSDL